jgi:hypothetical protein
MSRTLCIQVHPNRAPDLDLARLRSICDVLATRKDLIARFSANGRRDKGPYINLMFETGNPEKLWRLLRTKLYRDKAVGAALARASMAVIEGKQGWDDYYLLFHFDPDVPVENPDSR